MSRQHGLFEWIALVSTHMSHLSVPQARVLALWSYGIALTRSCGRLTVATFLALLLRQKVATVEQRLYERCCEAQHKAGGKRCTLEVTTCFVPLLRRHVEELMEERGVSVDHATIQRWVVKYSPLLEEAFHRHKRPVWVSWRMDETYIKVKGQWRYLYRAVDKHGQTIDFLLTKERDELAAKRFLTKAIRRHGVPGKITIDGSAANEAAIKRYNAAHATTIAIRKIKLTGCEFSGVQTLLAVAIVYVKRGRRKRCGEKNA